MNTTNFFKKLTTTIIYITLFISLNTYAKDTTDFVQLAESGTATQIESTLRTNSGLALQTFGTNKETLLMVALKNDRDLEIVTLLVKAGSKLDAKAKDKRTPIMFCSRFTTKLDVLEFIISSNTIGSSAKKKRILAKDKLNKTAFDYARKNPVSEVYNKLCEYATDPGEATSSTEETSTASTGKSAEDTKTTSSGMHTVTATFTNTAKVDEDDDEEETTATTTQTAAATTAPAKTPTPAAPVTTPAAPVTTPTATVATTTATGTTIASSVAAATPAKTTTTPVATPAPAANTTTTEPYNKSYLYDYLNDTTAKAPTEEPTTTVTSSIDNVNLADKNGVTLLMQAAKSGNDWAVQHLLNSGADVQSRDKDGWSALMYAVRYQNSINIVNMLIEKGAHARVRNNYNATPLLLAANYSQNPQILSLLLRNRSATEDEVFKAFILALTSTEGSEYIEQTKVQLFLDMGVSVNRVWKGKTPLMYAAQYSDSTAVIGLLIQAGAKPGTQNVEGKTAFDFAKGNSRLAHDDIYWSLNSVTK